MLKQISIENFQSIRGPLEIEFGKLTFLYGPNSIGKSAVFDALDVLARFVSGDPSVVELIEEGTRPPPSIDLGSNEKVDYLEYRNRRLSLSARLYVDAVSLAESPVGTESLLQLPGLQTTLNDGAAIAVNVQFRRDDFSHPRDFSLSVNDKEVVHYRHESTDYDPYYRHTDSFANAEVSPCSSVVGEWTLAPEFFDFTGTSDDLLLSDGARARFLTSRLEDGGVRVRGLSLSTTNDSGLVYLPQETMELIFPSEFDLEPTINAQKKHLHSFGFSSRDADPEALEAFLRTELNGNNSTKLYSSMRSASALLTALFRGLFPILSPMFRLTRVKGDRTAIRSEDPLHLNPKLGYSDKEPRDPLVAPTGMLVTRPDLRRDSFDGNRRWPSGITWTSMPTELRKAFERYVSTVNEKAQGDPANCDEADFPNFALSRYLHSLSRYRFVTEDYLIVAPYTLSDAASPAEFYIYDSQDESRLSGTRLVFFSVIEDPAAVRPFRSVGSSLGYLFPVLIALGDNGFCALEQPELHLHPLAQEQLADVFLHAANRGCRAIIESHSESFLLRLAERINETRIKARNRGAIPLRKESSLAVDPGDLRVYMFTHRPETGTAVQQVRFGPDGSLLDDWPDGLFDKSWGAALGRLKLFSKEGLNADQAAADWPWVTAIAHADPLTAKWLAFCWMFDRLGDQQSTYAIYVGKIVERCLAARLLDPLIAAPRQSSAIVDKRWQRESDDYFRDRVKAPPLGWWKQTLVSLRQGTRHPLIEAIHEEVSKQPWAPAFTAALTNKDRNLIHMVDALVSARNVAAHSGEYDGDRWSLIAPLVCENARPGVLFSALGYVGAGEFRKPYLVQ